MIGKTKKLKPCFLFGDPYKKQTSKYLWERLQEQVFRLNLNVFESFLSVAVVHFWIILDEYCTPAKVAEFLHISEMAYTINVSFL